MTGYRQTFALQQRARRQGNILSCSARLFLIACLLFVGGCADNHPEKTEPIEDIVKTISAHGVGVTLTLAPGEIDPREDALLTVQISHPSNLQVTYPNLSTRLEGFNIAATLESPEREPIDGVRTSETTIRITPIPGQSYRIAPILFEINTGLDDETNREYLITPAIRPDIFRKEYDDTPTLSSEPKPLYIPPTRQEIALWIVLFCITCGVCVLLMFLLRKIRERVRILRLSPTERARYELSRLLEKDLPGNGQYKEFYFAITSIIRTYIERRHGIRAPELTTPEFLDAASQRPEFDATVVEKLKQFLESADLVKFAAWMPSSKAIDEAIETAQQYLTEDASVETEGGT